MNQERLVLFKERLFTFKLARFLQATPDLSEGADCLLNRYQQIILVDGQGSGKTGDHEGAFKLANSLAGGDRKIGDGVYIDFLIKSDAEARIRASGGTFGVLWRRKDDSLEPDIFYFGDDTDSQPIDTIIDIKDVAYLMLATDGAVNLLGRKDFLGELEGFNKKNAAAIATMISMSKFNATETLEFMKRNLLFPITTLLNSEEDLLIAHRKLEEIMREFKQNYTRGDVERVTDDATLVFSPISFG